MIEMRNSLSVITGWGETQPGIQLTPGWLPFARFSRRFIGRPVTRMVLVLSRVLIGFLVRLFFVLPLLVLIVWHVLPPRRGVRHRANTPGVGSFRYCPAPHSNTDGSPETENRSERHLPEHSAILGCDLELLPVYNVTGQNLLSQYLPRSLDGFLMGNVERGKLCSFRIFFEGTRLSDVEVIPGHVVSIHSSRSNQQDDPPFPPPAQDLIGQALADTAAERVRQIEAERWTPGHDDAHSDGELARAAACYAYCGSWSNSDREKMAQRMPQNWPRERAWWKPTNRRLDLVKAAALIIDKIERLDRAALATPEGLPE